MARSMTYTFDEKEALVLERALYHFLRACEDNIAGLEGDEEQTEALLVHQQWLAEAQRLASRLMR